MTEITGKKRIVVDDSIFMDLNRGPDGQVPALPEYLGGTYIGGPANKDTLRIALGKHWDYNLPEDQQATAGGTKIFKNENRF